MRILLTGVTGQVGVDILPLLSKFGEVIAVGRAECDLAQPDAIRSLVADVRPTVIVNPAAYTAVNEAETHRDLCYAINSAAPAVLAESAAKLDAVLIHYSTDYVFDGTKQGAYTELDQPSPLNVYGASKLAGEQAIAAAGGRYIVLRTSWVYGANGSNFLRTMRKLAHEREELKIVDDQVGAPTSSMHLAVATCRILESVHSMKGEQFPSGVYHASAAGSVSWCGFARAIVAAFEYEDFKVRKIVPISSDEYPTPARRPRNSLLSNDKFEGVFGFRIGDWRSGLSEVIQEIRRRESRVRNSNCK